jgi:hypothetical protein
MVLKNDATGAFFVFNNRTYLLDPKNFSVSRYSAQRLEKELGKSER